MVCIKPKNKCTIESFRCMYSSVLFSSFMVRITIFSLGYVHVGYLHIIIHSGVSESILCERSSEKSVISMCGRAHLFFAAKLKE